MPVVWDVILAFARGFDYYIRSLKWRDEAGCLGSGPGIFFPSPMPVGRPGSRYQEVKEANRLNRKKAKLICSSCAVQISCRIYALMSNEFQGIYWADGLSPVWGGIVESDDLTRLRQDWVLGFARAGLGVPSIEHPTLDRVSVKLSKRLESVKEASVEEVDSAIGRASMQCLPNILGLLTTQQVIGNRTKIITRVARRLLISDPAAKQRIDWLCEHGYLRLGEQDEKEQLLPCEKAFDESAPVEQVIGPNPFSSRSTETQIVRAITRTEAEGLTDGLDATELSVLDALSQKVYIADELNDASDLLAIELDVEEGELRKIVRRLQSKNYLVIIASDETPFGVIRLSGLGLKVFPPEDSEPAQSQQTATVESVHDPEGQETYQPEPTTMTISEVQPTDIPMELKSKHNVTEKTQNILAVLYGLPHHRLEVNGSRENMRPILDVSSVENIGSINGAMRRLSEKGLIVVEMINSRRTKYIEITPLGVATLLYHRPELATGAEVVKTDDPAVHTEDDEAVSTHETVPQVEPVVVPAEAEPELSEDDVQSTASLGDLLDEEQRGAILLLVEELRARRDQLSGQISDLRIELFATEQQLDVLNLLLAKQG